MLAKVENLFPPLEVFKIMKGSDYIDFRKLLHQIYIYSLVKGTRNEILQIRICM